VYDHLYLLSVAAIIDRGRREVGENWMKGDGVVEEKRGESRESSRKVWGQRLNTLTT
jgi:hypothetical protein